MFSRVFRSSGNKAYPLKLGSSIELDVYCHMANDLGACGGSGWTLVMKIDGNKVEMGYFIVCFANFGKPSLTKCGYHESIKFRRI